MGKEGLKRLLVVAGALVLAACANQATEPPPPPPPVVHEAPPPPPPPKPVAWADQCGASGLQYLVGKPKTDIPIPLEPSRRRVVCSTCPMTMDYSPVRQTILFDVNSGIVTEVKCG